MLTPDMERAIKLIASLYPTPVKPYSLGDIGGVKIISNPHMPEGSIMLSDSVFRDLQQYSEFAEEETVITDIKLGAADVKNATGQHVVKINPHHKRRYTDKCKHGKGLNDYCEPCGRIHNA